MFRNKYQGAGAVELFSAKGSDPVGKWKLSGTSTSIRREYNKELRGLVYCLEGGCQAVKMQMPANEKMSLGLVQQFLVLQVNVPKDKDFSIELVVTDKTQLKRRLYLSTVHKELSTTLWHARIPFVGLKRDVWSTLFIDLVSFTGNLFKDAGFSSLDGISVSATCSVRRIFTVHPELKGAANHGALFREAALADAIPRSCRLPSDLDPQPQIWSMETLVERVAEKSTSARSAGHQKTKPQGFLRKTPGCRATRTSTPSGRRSHAHGEDRDEGRLVACQKEGANTAEVESVSQSFVHLEHEGAARSVQSQLPKDRQPGKQASVENMKVASPGCLRRGSCGAEKMGEPSSPTTNRKVSSVLTPSEKMKPATVEHLSGWNRRGPSSDPWVRSGWDSIDEPEFTLQDEAFAFKSQPHSPKRRQGRGDQEQTEGADECASDYSGRRFEASPEDDFVSSEADEDEPNAEFRDQVINVRPSTTTSEMKYTSGSEAPFTSQDLCEERLAVPEDVRVAGRGGAGSDVMVPKRCFSPCNGAEEPKSCHRAKHSLEGSRSVRLSRRILKEARAEDLKRQQGADSTPGSSDFRGRSLLLSRSDECDAEEMRMLASLRREQEEDENQASGLSASQIHQCHVSMSMSSDDNSTWTHISMPANQGCHYQNEMTPPERSDPRQWMDVLSPPLIPPTPERSDSSGKLIEHPSAGSPAGGDAPVNDGDECLNLLYDSCLNCYFDPLTGKYYELA